MTKRVWLIGHEKKLGPYEMHPDIDNEDWFELNIDGFGVRTEALEELGFRIEEVEEEKKGIEKIPSEDLHESIDARIVFAKKINELVDAFGAMRNSISDFEDVVKRFTDMDQRLRKLEERGE